MSYHISLEALKDLEDIWLYTFENWSQEQADRYYNLIIDEIENISREPLSGKNCDAIRKGYYRSRVNSHFIFYKFELKVNGVQIIRILHQQMDIESHLNE